MKPLSFVTILAFLPFVLIPLVRADLPDLDTLTGPPPTTFNWPTGDGNPTDPASTSYTTGSPSRLAIYVPGDTYKQYPGWLVLYKMLLIIGVPTFVTKDLSIATQSQVMLAYQILNQSSIDGTTSAQLDSYVRSGKTLIATSFNTSDTTLTTLFGIQVDTTSQNDNNTVRGYIGLLSNNVSQAAYNIMSEYDYTDTRDTQIPIFQDDYDTSFPTIAYTAASNSTVQALATIIDYETNTSINTTVISLMTYPTGGMAIAFGIDIGAYIGISNGGNTGGIPRSYAAQYEPGYDTFLRLIKSIYIQGGGGVTTWPVKNNMGVYFAWTYDIDASDSWAGAVTCAKSLAKFSAKGTINWQTKLSKDAYDQEFFTLFRGNISLVEAVGNGMEMASHSVSHTPNLSNLTVGSGNETFTGPHYDEVGYWPYIGECSNTTIPGSWVNFIPNTTFCDTPNEILYFYTTADSTLFGETRVSKFLVEAHSSLNAVVRTFRSGHLIFPNAIGQVLEATGYKYSSMGSSNDQNTHLPFQLMFNKGYNQEVDVIESSMTSSDGDTGEPNINDVWALPGDLTYPNGSSLYRQFTLLNKIKRYGASYTFLLHPTDFGVNVPWATNKVLFKDKLAFQEAFLPLISNISYFDTVGGRGDFTKTRMQTAVDWKSNGTFITITVSNPAPIELLTLRVPPTWTIVSATTPVSPFAGGFVILGSIPPGTYQIIYANTTSSNPAFTITGEVPDATTSLPIPTITTHSPSPTPDPYLLIDDFSNPPRYSDQTNAIGFYTSDDHTMLGRTSVQGDYLFLNFTQTSYWYSLLGPVGYCNDLKGLGWFEIAFRFPTGIQIPFDVNFVDLDLQTCNVTTNHLINIGGPSSNYPFQAVTDWQKVRIPLDDFGANIRNSKGIQLRNFSGTGIIEIDYLQMGSAGMHVPNILAIIMVVIVAFFVNV